MRRVALALMGAAALLLAPLMALAQPPAASVGTYQVPQPGGGTINDCAVQVGALPSTVFHPCHVMESVDQYGVPHPIGPSNPMPIAIAGGSINSDGGLTVHVANTPNVQAVSGSVTTTPATGSVQPVSGSVTTTPAAGSTQAISGAVTVTGPVTTTPTAGSTQAVSGSVSQSGVAFLASGLSAITTTISAAGASNPITPVAGRGGLHWLISGTGVATCAMEQQVNSAWYPITINGQPFGVISYTGSPVNETSQENGYGIPHRLNCGATNVSGAANGSFTSGSLSVTLVQP